MTGSPQPLVWALDLATVTGLAIGRVDEEPVATSHRLAPGSSPLINDLFLGCMRWFDARLREGPLPDILMIEELLPPTARRGTTNTQTQHRLAGLHGIVRALAGSHCVPEIASANVQDVRQHFIHKRAQPRDVAKREVMVTCKMLGWTADDTNCGDALALWSYTVALINPASALKTTPLFGPRRGPTWKDVARDRESKRS